MWQPAFLGQWHWNRKLPYESYTDFVDGDDRYGPSSYGPIVLAENIGIIMLPRRRQSGSPVEQRYEDTAPAVKGSADVETRTILLSYCTSKALYLDLAVRWRFDVGEPRPSIYLHTFCTRFRCQQKTASSQILRNPASPWPAYTESLPCVEGST